MRHRFASIFVLLACVLTSALAWSAPRDKAAQKKIEEAMYEKFLNTDFDAAEGLLLGTVRACEDKCSPALLAKAWMFVGVVRGSGRNDLPGAEEAFTTALGIDPNVALDNETATDPVKAVFAKVKGGGGAASSSAPSASAPSSDAAFKCSPSPTEIESRRPFPMQCDTEASVVKAKLHYKAFSQSWATVAMEQHEGMWRGTIPCAATQNTGKLKFYVEGLDADGEVVASLGEKEKPESADIVSESSADPPAFPEEEPPARCTVTDEPPGGALATGGACGSWGAPCGANDCCEEGLSCNAGTCEGRCESNGDCKNGATCEDGKCVGGEAEGKPGEVDKNWLTLGVAMDIASISSPGACHPDARSKEHIACFEGKATYENTPSAAAPGRISGGLTPSTARLLVGYERLFGSLGAEVKLGFAFNGGPTPSGGGSPFMPFHAEVRGKWWVLGEKAFTQPGLRPWLHLGGGLAQIDATVGVDIIDCGVESANPSYQQCVDATSEKEAKANRGRVRSFDATKQLGRAFVTAGGGAMYVFGKNHGAVLNLSFMIPFPSSGLVLEPMLGYAVGF